MAASNRTDRIWKNLRVIDFLLQRKLNNLFYCQEEYIPVELTAWKNEFNSGSTVCKGLVNAASS
jgi:hypothetical protein